MKKKENIQYNEIEERLEMAQVAAASVDRCNSNTIKAER